MNDSADRRDVCESRPLRRAFSNAFTQHAELHDRESRH